MDNATRVDITTDILSRMAEICGEFSQTRKMLIRLGKSLLNGEARILVPVCPDYAHRDGKYTFDGLCGDIPLLAQKHIAFLRRLQVVCPTLNPQVLMLMADHEADDPALVRTVRKSREEFLMLLNSSVEKMREAVVPMGWQVEAMTKIIPSLVEDEERVYQEICANPAYRGRIISDTIKRMGMYVKYGNLSPEEMEERTARTSAQYVVLGRYAAHHGFMVCNHTTTNLSWYLQTEAAVLHNPVEIY